jgi:hypothetical protein
MSEYIYKNFPKFLVMIAVALGLVITVTLIIIESQNPPKVVSSKTYTWSDDKQKQAEALIEKGYSKQSAANIVGNTATESDSNPTIFVLRGEKEPFSFTNSFDNVVNQIINYMTKTTFDKPIRQFDIENDTIYYDKSELELHHNQDFKFKYYSLDSPTPWLGKTDSDKHVTYTNELFNFGKPDYFIKSNDFSKNEKPALIKNPTITMKPSKFASKDDEKYKDNHDAKWTVVKRSITIDKLDIKSKNAATQYDITVQETLKCSNIDALSEATNNTNGLP